MESTEIQALINDAIAAAKTDILAEVTRANQGLAASLTKEVKKVLDKVPAETAPAQEEQPQEKLSLKALQQQIADLTNQLQEKDKKAFIASRDAALSQAIAAVKSTAPTALQKLFLTEFGESIKQEGNQWFVTAQDGSVKDLNTSIKDYLASPEGQIFVPASEVQGSGSKETTPTPATQKSELSLDDMYNQLYQNFNS